MVMNKRTCEECEKKFRSSNKKAKYCSIKCRAKNTPIRKTVLSKCPNCNKKLFCTKHKYVVSEFRRVHKPSEVNHIIIDLDGTLCDNVKRINKEIKSVKDWIPYYKYIPEDKLNLWCAQIMMAYELSFKTEFIFLTGRPEKTRKATEEWLINNLRWLRRFSLYMRCDGDYREDYIVKRELLKTKIIKKHKNIILGIDDRPENVNVFREFNIPSLYCGEIK